MAKSRLYRSSNGKIMGVCSGIAEWLNVDVGMVRLAFIVGFFVTGSVLLFIYIALGVFLPVDDYKESDSIFDKFRNEYSCRTRSNSRSNGRYTKSRRSRNFTVEDVKDEFENLKSRVGKMEDNVFNKEKDWDERFKKS